MSRVRPAGRLTPAGRTPGRIAPTWPHGPGETSDITRARIREAARAVDAAEHAIMTVDDEAAQMRYAQALADWAEAQ
uniref:hypothetical protein n=1 Tax=Streptomyces sp. S-9 TaxID=2806600 RepID=UPI00193BC5B6